MAFRSQTRIGLIALLSVVASWATEFRVTHNHLRRDEPGVLRIGADGVSYSETKKHDEPHDFRWEWDDIQQLVLRPDAVEITTYKDVKWLGGRDRRFVFKGTDLQGAYPALAGHLPRRLVPQVAVLDGLEKVAELPAKKLDGLGGHEGMLLVAKDRLVFQSEGREGSQTWILDEVENISSVDPLDLTVSSLGSDYRLQLKRPLPEGVYRDLWRKLNLRSTY